MTRAVAGRAPRSNRPIGTRCGAITNRRLNGPRYRYCLALLAHAGGNPHHAVLTATDREVLAAWVDGRAILLSESLPESLAAGPCVALKGMTPRVCSVLSAFGLSPAMFTEWVEEEVPVYDASRQAPCEAPMSPRSPPSA